MLTAVQEQLPVCPGEVTGTVTTSHFNAIEVLHPSGAGSGPHTHSSDALRFAVTGAYVEDCGGECRACDEITVAVRSAGELHSLRFADCVRSVVIAAVSREAARNLRILAQRQRFIRGETLRPFFLRIWREMHQHDDATQLALDGAVFLLLAELMRITGATPSDSKSPLALQLDRTFAAIGPQPGLSDLAAANNMSWRTYSRQFKRETGCSVVDYLRRLRTERAKGLLRTTSLSIREIALDLGYCDQSHFAREFCRNVGVTPSSYRRSVI